MLAIFPMLYNMSHFSNEENCNDQKDYYEVAKLLQGERFLRLLALMKNLN